MSSPPVLIGCVCDLCEDRRRDRPRFPENQREVIRVRIQCPKELGLATDLITFPGSG